MRTVPLLQRLTEVTVTKKLCGNIYQDESIRDFAQKHLMLFRHDVDRECASTGGCAPGKKGGRNIHVLYVAL
jgi:hypothetical protein